MKPPRQKAKQQPPDRTLEDRDDYQEQPPEWDEQSQFEKEADLEALRDAARSDWVKEMNATKANFIRAKQAWDNLRIAEENLAAFEHFKHPAEIYPTHFRLGWKLAYPNASAKDQKFYDALCKSLVEAMNGSYRLRSGHGENAFQIASRQVERLLRCGRDREAKKLQKAIDEGDYEYITELHDAFESFITDETNNQS